MKLNVVRMRKYANRQAPKSAPVRRAPKLTEPQGEPVYDRSGKLVRILGVPRG